VNLGFALGDFDAQLRMLLGEVGERSWHYGQEDSSGPAPQQ
jgi:hypothetical protein